MTTRAGRAILLLGVLVFLGWAVLGAGQPARAGSYSFRWAPGLAGYGGYLAEAADLDGDGHAELVVQAVAGEAEGQEPPPPRITAVYACAAPAEACRELGRSRNVGPLAAVADLDGDGRTELVARDESGQGLTAWRWAVERGELVPEPADVLDAYRQRGGLLPGDLPGEVEGWPRDLDGDGLLDGIALVEGETGAELVLRTATAERRLPLAGHPEEAGVPRGHEPAASRPGSADAETSGPPDLGDVQVEAWLPASTPGWPVVVVGWQRAGSRTVELSASRPDGDRYQPVWQDAVAGGAGPYALSPAWALLDLTGDGTPELVRGRGGVVEVLAWDGRGFQVVARTPENGGLGWAGFHAADLNGNGVPELVARHVSPNLYTHHLKVYELRGGRLVGLADLRDIGWWAAPRALTWRAGSTEVLLLPRASDLARPEALAFDP
ncbi:FG-GAP repeat domain-containing protein [Limnochorda pilosa]|uniref:FG-GAP repeat protein n=1 Tax=Limnochorda pilosa TaxID=1555112 RepID=A0A0K2SKU6_LIMPI|nr:VCBS repeat-containing protein [Limnochorda pilosa]BAS27731.1 hypothetical protein LIP_1890 [Limnochorda pilosa]